MNRIAITIGRAALWTVAGLLPLLAHSQIYTCKDAAGARLLAIIRCRSAPIAKLSN
ncbi:hypothetical protein CAter282_4247 [Collimonas arenae]|uniref:Uncharacterized protein n=1 Tax=Collimonas arenae TaxID=279058 RepID=A0A127QPL3_9BURK|nr:hypothetical protein CAter282_4247 [Collimonas arenae]